MHGGWKRASEMGRKAPKKAIQGCRYWQTTCGTVHGHKEKNTRRPAQTRGRLASPAMGLVVPLCILTIQSSRYLAFVIHTTMTSLKVAFWLVTTYLQIQINSAEQDGSARGLRLLPAWRLQSLQLGEHLLSAAARVGTEVGQLCAVRAP